MSESNSSSKKFIIEDDSIDIRVVPNIIHIGNIVEKTTNLYYLYLYLKKII